MSEWVCEWVSEWHNGLIYIVLCFKNVKRISIFLRGNPIFLLNASYMKIRYLLPCKCSWCKFSNNHETVYKKMWLTWLTVSRLLNSSRNTSKKLLTAWSCCFSFLSRTLCMCCMACMRASDSDKLCWIAEAWVATISLYFFSEASVFQHICDKSKETIVLHTIMYLL